ncbi:MAG: phosphohydrolase [bacterium]|nr:phosphohydrolase [bacterium]MDD5354498.1 phosphohydrolase [bacterium]MDD5756001.1 phosphohydrolase [bacterium]
MSNNADLAAVKKHPLVVSLLEGANRYLGVIGFTEHGHRHANLVSNIAQNVLSHLKYTERLAELAAVAGYLHDVGNVISRVDHGISSSNIAIMVLRDLNMDPDEITEIVGAIGNHEEEFGDPVSAVAAALILADKSDVHRSRVRNPNMVMFDIHDRVNYAAEKSFLRVDADKRIITLEITIDTTISQVMEYFEIFLSRMVISRRAAKFLECNFSLMINDHKLL